MDLAEGIMPMSEIQMTVDPKSGGMKEAKKAKFHLIPSEFLWALAEHYGGNTPEYGGKYPARNWEKGYAWSLSEDSVFRHYYAWKQGQRYDTGEGGTGMHHLICCAWHVICLFIFDTRKIGRDDVTSLEETPR